MFCNQCEQTAHGSGCVMSPGVCGKNDDVQSLQETLLYGLKGMAAYAHARPALGKSDEQVSAFIEEALFATMTNVNFDVESLLEMVLECGRQNLRVMQLLDEGHVEKFGNPSPGPVREGTQAGPGILITGPRLAGPAQSAQAVRGYECQGVHARRNAAGAHVPGAPRTSSVGRTLRRGLAEAEDGVRAVHRADAGDDQLRVDSSRVLRGSPVHDALHGGARRDPDRQRRFLAGDCQGQAVPAAAGHADQARPRRASTTAWCCRWPGRSSTR